MLRKCLSPGRLVSVRTLSGTAKDVGSPSGCPREPASPMAPGALIRPQRQELGSRGAVPVARHEHRWAEAPGQSLGPQALAGAGGNSRRAPGPISPRPGHPTQKHTYTRARAGGPAPHSPLAAIYRVFVVPLEPRQLGHMHPTEIRAALPFIQRKRNSLTSSGTQDGLTAQAHARLRPLLGDSHHN